MGTENLTYTHYHQSFQTASPAEVSNCQLETDWAQNNNDNNRLEAKSCRIS